MILYNILIQLYFCGIWTASFFSPKAKKWIEGRKDLQARISSFPFARDKWVWFHCSSFGEFQEGRNLIEAFKSSYPGYKILLTFFSPSGYEINKDYAGADLVFYQPLDIRGNAIFFLETVKPKAVLFVRNDIWPNYISEAAKRKIPVFLASFTLTADSSFLNFPVKDFYRNIFKKCSAVFVQNEQAAKILLGEKFSPNVIVTGSSRVDRIIAISKEEFTNPEIEKFVSGHFCCIAGSAHTKDAEIFLQTFKKLENENLRWIMVPHDIDKGEITAAKSELGDGMVCLSEINKMTDKTRLLWIDKVGLLAKIYRYTDVAFIGGGFIKTGIHNILEPAVYGCPVCFGPIHRNQNEALDLMQSGGAEIVHDADELSAFILKYKNDNTLLEKAKKSNQNYLIANAGGTKKMMDYLIGARIF